jgi:hypothetical protein
VKSHPKQACLKPQDLIVALKFALAKEAAIPTFAELGRALCMSASETHAAAQRAVTSRLLETNGGSLRANTASLQEFVLHGLRYVFPGVEGRVARGLPTGVAAPHFRGLFDQSKGPVWVWPDEQGDVQGPSLCPLYPSVPAACRQDAALYRMLSSLDALRAGAAREREVAEREVLRMLS